MQNKLEIFPGAVESYVYQMILKLANKKDRALPPIQRKSAPKLNIPTMFDLQKIFAMSNDDILAQLQDISSDTDESEQRGSYEVLSKQVVEYKNKSIHDPKKM